MKKIDFEIWIEIWKIWNMSQKFEMKKLKFSIFKFGFFSFLKFEMKIFVYFFKKFGHITKWKWKKNWNEEIVYFAYATEIKLLIILLYHPYHLCIPPYTTCASCGGIQLILAVGSFHIGPFPTVVWVDMIHHKRIPVFLYSFCGSLRLICSTNLNNLDTWTTIPHWINRGENFMDEWIWNNSVGEQRMADSHSLNCARNHQEHQDKESPSLQVAASWFSSVKSSRTQRLQPASSVCYLSRSPQHRRAARADAAKGRRRGGGNGGD
jgi:hypothetical protein